MICYIPFKYHGLIYIFCFKCTKLLVIKLKQVLVKMNLYELYAN